MHQTKKGNQWHFGMKAQIGVDARTGQMHGFTTAAAKEHNLNQAEHLLHGKENLSSPTVVIVALRTVKSSKM